MALLALNPRSLKLSLKDSLSVNQALKSMLKIFRASTKSNVTTEESYLKTILVFSGVFTSLSGR